MTARERYNADFAEQKAKDALDNDDLSLETVEELLGMINIPASSRRKHVIPRGEKKVQGLLFGLYCHHGAAGITVATDECPHLVKLLAKIMKSVDPAFPFTSIQVNANYASRPHVDKHNLGMSYIVSC